MRFSALQIRAVTNKLLTTENTEKINDKSITTKAVYLFFFSPCSLCSLW